VGSVEAGLVSEKNELKVFVCTSQWEQFVRIREE